MRVGELVVPIAVGFNGFIWIGILLVKMIGYPGTLYFFSIWPQELHTQRNPVASGGGDKSASWSKFTWWLTQMVCKKYPYVSSVKGY